MTGRQNLHTLACGRGGIIVESNTAYALKTSFPSSRTPMSVLPSPGTQHPLQALGYLANRDSSHSMSTRPLGPPADSARSPAQVPAGGIFAHAITPMVNQGIKGPSKVPDPSVKGLAPSLPQQQRSWAAQELASPTSPPHLAKREASVEAEAVPALQEQESGAEAALRDDELEWQRRECRMRRKVVGGHGGHGRTSPRQTY